METVPHGYHLFMQVMVLATFLILSWQVLRAVQSFIANRAAIASDAAYRKLAEETTRLQQQTTERLTELSNRLGAVEQMLRQVE